MRWICWKMPIDQVIELQASNEARMKAKEKKPRKLFGELTNAVSAQHGEVVTITQASFGRKMRRERRATSNLPGKDPVTWVQFKDMLPAELRQTIAGEDFARFLFVFLCNRKT